MSIRLKAGFARADITPSFSVPLAGYGNAKYRMSEKNLDPLYASCVAISDGENTALFYHLDLTGCQTEMAKYCREEIEKKYKIPQKNIFMTATHTHSAPSLNGGTEEMDCIKTYISEILCPALIGVVEPALADLEDAELWIGSGKTDGLNFVRRYLLSDGTYGGDNFGDFKKNQILAHESEADPTMQVLCLKRIGKKDILMVNWQAHPHRTGGFRALNLSSDLIHHFRLAMEESGEYHFAYFQGCAGNLNSHSRIPEENTRRTPNYYDKETIRAYRDHGRCLAEACRSVLPTLRPVKSGKIQALVTPFGGKVNHSWDHRLEDAKRVNEIWKSGQSDEARALALELGFHSVYHCSAVATRVGLPETIEYDVYGVSIGDFAFVGTPNEMYDTTGIYLKGASPFEMTFVCGYTNASGFGYMPTIKAFAHGGYGCDTCRFSSGAAEALADTLLRMLVELYRNK